MDEKDLNREKQWLITGILLGGILGFLGNVAVSTFFKLFDLYYSSQPFYYVIIISIIFLASVVALCYIVFILYNAVMKEFAK